MTHVRCLILRDSANYAQQRLADEQGTLKEVAKVTFEAVLSRDPELYLDPMLSAENVTLELLSDVYQQARLAGVDTGVPKDSPTGLFEHLRQRVYGASWFFGMAGRAPKDAATKLRYLIACLEDVNRAGAMRLRLKDAAEKGYSLKDLEAQAGRRVSEKTPSEPVAVGLAFA